MSQDDAEAFAKVVDENIKAANMEYKAKRDSFRLHDPAVFRLQDRSFEKFKEAIVTASGQDASRFKPNVLNQNEERHAVIGRYVL